MLYTHTHWYIMRFGNNNIINRTPRVGRDVIIVGNRTYYFIWDRRQWRDLIHHHPCSRTVKRFVKIERGKKNHVDTFFKRFGTIRVTFRRPEHVQMDLTALITPTTRFYNEKTKIIKTITRHTVATCNTQNCTMIINKASKVF